MRTLILLTLWGGMLFVSYSQNLPTRSYESAFLYQGRYPDAASSLDWFPDDYEVQGVANDGHNWFFTITDQDKTHGIMWRIPKSVNLNGNVSGNVGVKSVNYLNVLPLSSQGLWHWGDPDHMKYNGDDYILVPMYGNNTPRVVACFRASTLEFINYSYILNGVHGGWCAVGKDGDIYGSVNNPSEILRFDVDWANLTNKNETPDTLTYLNRYSLTQSNGSSLSITDMQGGEFSNSGEILYLVSGRGKCFGQGADWTPADGIHAIETFN